jgi:hypothetical protein
MTYLTIFSTPKPFTNPHIATIQRNAIHSWTKLGVDVQIVLAGNETGVKEAATEAGVSYEPNVELNAEGTPLISSIFAIGRNLNDSPYLAFLNADIIVFPELLSTLRSVAVQKESFLLVGQRWDLEVQEALDFSTGWEERLHQCLSSQGRLHPPAGSDYFVFPRACFSDIPRFAVGRAGWDNWMIFKARWEHWPVIDATRDIQVIHQDHDYSHLPGGQTHYRLPETFENVRLAGGKRAIFHLEDSDMVLEKGKLSHPSFSWARVKRELETFPLINLHSFALAQCSYALFHPQKAYVDLRGWLKTLGNKQ